VYIELIVTMMGFTNHFRVGQGLGAVFHDVKNSVVGEGKLGRIILGCVTRILNV
jgi:hypothetical protein